MPLTELTDALGTKRAAHLLRRTCGGATIAEIDTFAALTPAEAVTRLFDNSIPDPPLPTDPATGNEWVTGLSEPDEDTDVDRLFLQWHIGQMLGSGIAESQKLPYIFRERIIFFLHTHFTTKRSVVRNARALYYQQALFRLYAFDQEDLTVPPATPEETERIAPRNFKELTKKISVDNAMLVFLDGRLNVAGSPNENYARELLELYSVGRGLEGTNPVPEFIGDYFTFTEEDVQAGARVLSGFNFDDNFLNIDPDTGLPRGVVRGGNIASQHETGTKTFSNRLSSETVTPDDELLFNGNPTEESVIDEISQMVDIIYNQRETAIHIAREIYRFFVYHQIDESKESGVISDIADIFIANEFKIQPVLESLLVSQHFYDADTGSDDNNFGSIIKAPLELVLGFYRNFNITIPEESTDAEGFHAFAGDLLSEMSSQGMDYYEPFEVAGYAAYHQFPIYNRSWITTNYLTNRYNFIQNRILADTMNMEMGQVDILQFVIDNFDLNTIRIANDLIIAIAQYFLPVAENLSFETADVGELTVERLSYFKNAMLFANPIDADPEAAWTTRWDMNVDSETRANQLRDLFNAMLQTPEYQLM